MILSKAIEGANYYMRYMRLKQDGKSKINKPKIRHRQDLDHRQCIYEPIYAWMVKGLFVGCT